MWGILVAKRISIIHLLWIKKRWSKGYAKALRNHAWMKVLIPRDTLHKEIHHQIRTVPLPTKEDTKQMFDLLVRLEASGELDMNAGILERLDFLIEHLTTPETVAVLCKERGIVRQFYERESS